MPLSLPHQALEDLASHSPGNLLSALDTLNHKPMAFRIFAVDTRYSFSLEGQEDNISRELRKHEIGAHTTIRYEAHVNLLWASGGF